MARETAGLWRFGAAVCRYSVEIQCCLPRLTAGAKAGSSANHRALVRITSASGHAQAWRRVRVPTSSGTRTEVGGAREAVAGPEQEEFGERD
jgi:hypothetical protein